MTDHRPRLLDPWDARAKDGATSSAYSTDPEPLMRELSRHDNIRFVRKPIPEALDDVDAQTLAFVHMNTGVSVAEDASLPVVLRRLSTGAVVLVDAFGGPKGKGHFGALAEANGTLLYLLSGQAALFAA